MSILFSNEIVNAVMEELAQANDSVQIITAYCKKQIFEKIDSAINSKVQNRKLLVRFRMEDIVKRSTDFEILEYGLSHGWNVYVRFDLHAKTYIVDNKRAVVGSANATNAGMNSGKYGNMEIATFVDIEQEDIEKIDRLFRDAIPINKSIIDNMKTQIESISSNSTTEECRWDNSITHLFNPKIDTLFSYELPDEIQLHKGEYIAFLDMTYDGDISGLKEHFRWSNAYLWLLNSLLENEGCMYFGSITQRLHNSLITDPKPYRKDVKKMLANLLALIQKLNMEEIIIDTPNFSQRVTLRQYKEFNGYRTK